MMLTLSLLLSIMLLSALSFVVIPYSINYQIQKKSNLIILLVVCLFLTMTSIFLYQMSPHKNELKQWVNHGEQHYHLMQQYNALGGITGLIARVQRKLDENPRDPKGWFILGKLYIVNHDYASAENALRMAQHLNPSDPQNTHYLNMAIQSATSQAPA